MNIALYALVDPRKPKVFRYIGQAAIPRARHIQHCAELGPSKKCEWVESLRQDGIMPQMVILRWVDEKISDAEEKALIQQHAETITNTVNSKPSSQEGNLMEETERQLIAETLDFHGHNKQATAKALGIGRQTLYNKLRHYHITTK